MWLRLVRLAVLLPYRHADSWKLTPDAAYVHLCTNETIDGIEYQYTPDVSEETNGAPIVADMSSHIMSRVIDVSKYGAIFSGAQKNLGPGWPDYRGRARRFARQCPAILPLCLQLENHC